MLLILFFRVNLKLVIIMAPFVSVVAFVLNEIGFNNFWDFIPRFKNISLSSLPLNLGLYPVLGCLLVYSLQLSTRKPVVWMVFYGLITTGMEYVALVAKYIFYYNGWNIFHTFLSYLLAYILVFFYYKVMVRYDVL
ncbi:CBO0543 family protein [Bacillus niameyensis]|uniref:CBO0543 family protein n=1 Tax=Bacillus niameyensis TaxID=1522308 RepID=UPI001E35BAB9|nr:CBO0543 family protein [Bacillus niameyensis]